MSYFIDEIKCIYRYKVRLLIPVENIRINVKLNN